MMGILGNLFGMDDETSSDLGARIALASSVLSNMDQGRPSNIAGDIAALNKQRRGLIEQAKTQKWLQSQAAAMADKNPKLAGMLQDVPPEIGQSLVSRYYETLLQPPEWKTFESNGDVYRYNPNDPNSKPEVFFDAPDDPFQTLLKSITPPSQVTPPAPGETPAAPAPGEPPAVPAAPGETPDMPEPAAGGSLTPQMKIIAETFGLPPEATPTDVMAVANAGIVGGKEQAAKTAELITKRYADTKSQGIELSNKQIESAFKLQDDYWRVGQNYQKVIDTASEIASLPDDPNGFERLMTLYKFMRTLDPAGAVRESDAAMAQNADNIVSKIEQIAQKYTGMSGGDIPAGAAQEMKRLILELGETSSKADYKARKKVLKRAVSMGIPADKAEEMIFGGLQDSEADMEGYQPRFQPPERQSDQEMKDKAPEPFDLDPSQMVEGKIYEDADNPGTEYKLEGGKVKVNDGTGWRDMR
jgi:hypothetical protein